MEFVSSIRVDPCYPTKDDRAFVDGNQGNNAREEFLAYEACIWRKGAVLTHDFGSERGPFRLRRPSVKIVKSFHAH